MAQTLDANGNVIVDGMNTNLSPTQYGAIPVSTTTTNQQFIPVTKPQQDTTSLQQIIDSEKAGLQSAQTQYDTAQNQAKSENTALIDLLNAQGNQAQDTANAYSSTGATDAAAQIRQLNAQAIGLRNEAQAIPIANRLQAQRLGTAGTENQVQNINYDQLQQNALKALSLGQQAAIAQADYETAKSKADQMIAIKYNKLENDIKVRHANLEMLNRYTLTPAQEKLKTAQEQVLKRQEQQLAEKKASDTAIQNMIIEATPNAPQSVISNARKIAENGGSKLAVAQALGVYGGDYLKNELLREQLKQARVKTSTISADGRELVTQNGVQLVKVTPKEIQDLNDTQIAKNSLVSLVDNMIGSIDKYGTQVLFGKEAGTRSGAKTNLLLAMKNLEKTGALDKGTIDVLSGTIPDSEFFATEARQKAALQQLRDTVVNKTDEYINSYKGTTAETDPRTKRIYEQTGFVSTGNPQADEYIRQSMGAVSSVNNSMSTPNAVNAGYVDNQK